jgi:hypothetical protein
MSRVLLVIVKIIAEAILTDNSLKPTLVGEFVHAECREGRGGFTIPDAIDFIANRFSNHADE